MKKQLFALLLLAALLLSCSVFACAEAAQDTAQLAYITDHAGILSSSEREALETRAAQIASQYPCSIYVVTVQDFQSYSNTVAGCASGIYSYYDLGHGSGRDGVLLLLSMDDRDYYVYSYGSYANTVFYGKAGYLLDEAFLDNFRSNDWYGGFADYLDECERLLLNASEGSYADPEAQYYVDSGGKKYVCLRQPSVMELHSDGCQGQEIELVVFGLFSNELLVALSDQMITFVVDQHILGEKRLCIEAQDTGPEAVVGGFGVPVAVVHADDYDSVQFFHTNITSIPCAIRLSKTKGTFCPVRFSGCGSCPKSL